MQLIDIANCKNNGDQYFVSEQQDKLTKLIQRQLQFEL
jgi:hypothetical protein